MLLHLHQFAAAQDSLSNSNVDSSQITPPPTLSIGVGTLGYYGELNQSSGLNTPLISRMAVDIEFRQNINYFLEFYVNGWGGKISANERGVNRNLNFESALYGAGFGLNYNFGNFLKPDPILKPILGVGLEFISFNSKTDLLDANRVKYHYWSDGSIRNLPETASNAEQAIRLYRDYTYESDIKTNPTYNLDPYNTYTLAIPLKVGANLVLNENWSFRAAATYHFTFTDMLDGVSANNGAYKGDSKMDNLLYTSVSLGYNFKKKDKPITQEDAYEYFEEIDTTSDVDFDGVKDFWDECPHTPEGAEVDEKGCPVDGDKDGVGNYKDEELASAPGASVDTVGVTYTEEDLKLFYAMYFDETGNYSPIEDVVYSEQIIAGKTKRRKKKTTVYAVAIGEFQGDIPQDMINSILSVPDVNTFDHNGNVLVAVGTYKSVEEAKLRQANLDKQNINTTDIVAISPNGQISTISGNTASLDSETLDKSRMATSQQTIYRVQIGAYSKQPNESVYEGLPNVVAIKGDDGLIRYFSGVYPSYQEAARAKIDILATGQTGAFVVAFKGGNKVAIGNIRKVTLDKEQKNSMKSSEPLSEEQKKNLSFRVQVGSYSKQVPSSMLEKFMELGSVEQLKGDNGLIKYVAGNFDNYQDATAYKNELAKKGYNGCYVVAVYYGKVITSSEARKMLNR